MALQLLTSLASVAVLGPRACMHACELHMYIGIIRVHAQSPPCSSRPRLAGRGHEAGSTAPHAAAAADADARACYGADVKLWNLGMWEARKLRLDGCTAELYKQSSDDHTNVKYAHDKVAVLASSRSAVTANRPVPKAAGSYLYLGVWYRHHPV